MTIQELISLEEHIFKQIDDASKDSDKEKFKRLLNYPQPKEWMKPLPSLLDSADIIEDEAGNKIKVYYHNDIELIEGICDRLCFDWTYDISNVIITTTKSGVIITISVKSIFPFNWGEFILRKDGIASQFISSAALIEPSTAKTASMAWKNSAKKIGNLFGKSLNRGIENAPIESQNVTKKISKEEERMKALLDDATPEELDTFKLMVASSTDYIKDYYKTKIEEKLKS